MLRIAVVLLVAEWAGAAYGQPAPWYTWASNYDDTQVCAQTSPGQGWMRARGPYLDMNCTRPARTRLR